MKINMGKKRKFLGGFTLSEVLITLGIIGVVAALTIPVLINKQDQKKRLAAIKVAYAKITDGFLMMRSKEGVDDIRATAIFHGLNTDNFTDPDSQRQIDENMKQHFKIVSSYEAGVDCPICPMYLQLNGNVVTSGDPSYNYAWKGLTADGMTYYLHMQAPGTSNGQGKIRAIAAYFYVDINGPQAPNRWGTDMFQFAVAQNGVLYAPWGREFTESITPSTYWGNDASGCGSPNNPNASESSGYACTARIIENGWEIDY